MLVLSRMCGQSVMIGDEVTVTITDIRGDKVRLGISAPKYLRIDREEIREKIKQVSIDSANLIPPIGVAQPGAIMTRDFLKQNETSRAQLREFVARLTEADFKRPVGTAWTISTLLCHLAFWDQRVLYLLQEAKAGRIDPSRLGAQSIDSINQAVRVLSQAISGPAAAQMALQIAEIVDAEAATISDEIVEKIFAAGFERMLNRSLHRMDHLRKLNDAIK